MIDHEAGEPDPQVIDLNTDLGLCEEFFSTTLPEREQRYVNLIMSPDFS